MTEKELREIKRRFRPERTNIPKIVGCFVNGNGQIISKISQSIRDEGSVLSEMMLTAMKKTLSGAPGTNLTEIPFSSRQVLEGAEHKLLTSLLKSGLEDGDALSAFYSRVIESVKLEGNYAILIANDIYDVPSYSKGGDNEGSCEVFSYLICAICPVKNMPEALSFKENEGAFSIFSAASVLQSAELGFMFPTFEDRKTNIYNALLYTRSIAESYPAFVESIFGAEAPMPPKAQKAAFSECISSALGEDCSLQVVNTVQSIVLEMQREKKESRDPEPLLITAGTVKSMLADSGVAEGKIEQVGKELEESFGANAELTPRNIITTAKYELTTPDVTVKVNPERRDLVSTQVIGGEKYIMIKVSGELSVNGINICVDGE